MKGFVEGFVLLAIIVCLVIVVDVDWAVGETKTDTNLNDARDVVKNSFAAFAPGFSDFDLLNESIPGIPALNEGARMLKEKCLINSNRNDSYERITNARENFNACVKLLKIDAQTMKQEIEKKLPIGDLDLVFKDYCKKIPALKVCAMQMILLIEECLDENERENYKVVQNTIDNIVSFMCYDDGDRMALFYSEGGMACISKKESALNQCFNTSFSKYMPSDEYALSSLPKLKFDEEQCMSLSTLHVCVVSKLAECGDPTSANMVDSMLNFLQKSTPCSKFRPTVSGGMSFQASISFTTLVGSLTIMIGRTGY